MNISRRNPFVIKNPECSTNKTIFTIFFILLRVIDCIGQPRGNGRYYERNSELLPASTVIESTLLAVGLFIVGIFILSKNNTNPYVGVAGIGSMLVGLICLIPLFAYLFVALNFVILLVGFIALIAFIWQIINKGQKSSSNVRVKKNLPNSEEIVITAQHVRSGYISRSSKRNINKLIFLFVWPVIILGALIANAFIHDLFGFYILEYVISGFILIIGFALAFQLLIIVINIIRHLSNH